MCKFKSGIILKDRVFIPDYNYYFDMLKELKIKDEEFTSNFVKAKLIPPYGLDVNFTDYSKWIFKVDQDFLPEWYVEETDKERFIKEFSKWAENNIAINKEITKDSKNYKAYINCTGIICNNSNINLIYGGQFTSIYRSCIDRLINVNVKEDMYNCIIRQICNSTFSQNVSGSNITKSYSNKYKSIMNNYIRYSEKDIIDSSYDNYIFRAEKDTDINVMFDGVINYYVKDDEPKKIQDKLYCGTLININLNDGTYLIDKGEYSKGKIKIAN